jgi:hypothetical protein
VEISKKCYWGLGMGDAEAGIENILQSFDSLAEMEAVNNDINDFRRQESAQSGQRSNKRSRTSQKKMTHDAMSVIGPDIIMGR